MPKRKADSTSAAANLIRVRNNQRRSRARRNEYVAELERKVQECEVNGVPTRSIVPEETLRRLQGENRKLRELLAQAGIGQSAVDRHLYGHDDNIIQDVAGLVPDEVATSAELHLPVWAPLVDDARTSEADYLPTTMAALPNTTDELLVDSFLDLPSGDLPSDDFGLFYDDTLDLPAFDTSSIPQASLKPSLSTPSFVESSSSIPKDALSTLFAESSLPSSSQCDTESTLCSEAYEMLRQHNKKGVDMIEIGIRLWDGFTKGDGNGCKVENKLLFSVLEYVSG